MHIIDNLKLGIGYPTRPSGQAGGSMLESEEIRGRWRVGRQGTVGDLRSEISQLKFWREKYTRKYATAKDRIAELEDRIEDMSKAHLVILKNQDRLIQGMEDELARTKELLAARSTELSGAQAFLSTTDGLSESEVLGIVRDLNENIFQVAAALTEEWEKYIPSEPGQITQEAVDPFSQLHGPTLVCQVLERDPASVTFLLQSCLCYIVTEIAASWRGEDSEELGYTYQHLCATGGFKHRLRSAIETHNSRIPEGQAVSARWRALTHTNLHERSPPSKLIVNNVAQILWLTGSFSSIESSVDFVTKVASGGLETIGRLAIRLESAFMVDISSSDMYLLFGTPCTEFDDATMAREFEPDKAFASGSRKDKVAGTTEVGVEKILYGRKDEGTRMDVLLKAKVVVDGDLVLGS